jgi:hypothetical protein
MIRKEMLLPAWVFILMIVFAALCLLVWLSRGKNPLVLKQKMRVGAMILSLTATASGCIPIRTCYKPAPPKNVINFNKGGEVNLKTARGKSKQDEVVANKNSILKGRLSYMREKNFSYAITDGHGNELRRNNLALLETAARNENSFEIDLINIAKGTYRLNFYRTTQDAIGQEALERTFKLKIRD